MLAFTPLLYYNNFIRGYDRIRHIQNVKNLHIQEEKTMAKKILAILLALTFVVAFAACGGKEDDATTAPVETTEDIFAEVEETEAPAIEETEAPAAEAEAPAAEEAPAEAPAEEAAAPAETPAE